jgi:hypothetical protein
MQACCRDEFTARRYAPDNHQALHDVSVFERGHLGELQTRTYPYDGTGLRSRGPTGGLLKTERRHGLMR